MQAFDWFGDRIVNFGLDRSRLLPSAVPRSLTFYTLFMVDIRSVRPPTRFLLMIVTGIIKKRSTVLLLIGKESGELGWQRSLLGCKTSFCRLAARAFYGSLP